MSLYKIHPEHLPADGSSCALKLQLALPLRLHDEGAFILCCTQASGKLCGYALTAPPAQADVRHGILRADLLPVHQAHIVLQRGNTESAELLSAALHACTTEHCKGKQSFKIHDNV